MAKEKRVLMMSGHLGTRALMTQHTRIILSGIDDY